MMLSRSPLSYGSSSPDRDQPRQTRLSPVVRVVKLLPSPGFVPPLKATN